MQIIASHELRYMKSKRNTHRFSRGRMDISFAGGETPRFICERRFGRHTADKSEKLFEPDRDRILYSDAHTLASGAHKAIWENFS